MDWDEYKKIDRNKKRRRNIIIIGSLFLIINLLSIGYPLLRLVFGW